jgi:hypothetical protein
MPWVRYRYSPSLCDVYQIPTQNTRRETIIRVLTCGFLSAILIMFSSPSTFSRTGRSAIDDTLGNTPLSSNCRWTSLNTRRCRWTSLNTRRSRILRHGNIHRCSSVPVIALPLQNPQTEFVFSCSSLVKWCNDTCDCTTGLHSLVAEVLLLLWLVDEHVHTCSRNLRFKYPYLCNSWQSGPCCVTYPTGNGLGNKIFK